MYAEPRAGDVIVDSIGQKMHRCVDMKARLTYLKQFSDLQGNTSNQGLGLDLFLCVRTSVKP